MGHPINKRSPITEILLSASTGHQPKSYRKLTYELWEKDADDATFPEKDVSAMISAYESEATNHLAAILAHMGQAWPPKM